MTRVLILCVHRPGRAPGQRFRFEQYLPYLESHGYEFDFDYLFSAAQDRIFYRTNNVLAKGLTVCSGLLKRLLTLRKWRRYDLVFVQREALIVGLDFCEQFLARRLPMIYDFDDSIWLQNVSEGNRRFGFLKRPSKTRSLIRAATLVAAGNQYLAEYARPLNPNVVVLPTTIDTQEYQPRAHSKPAGAKICIGWSGSFSTIEHFKLALPALQEVQRIHGLRVCFKVIGDERYYCRELGVQGEAWRAASEVADLQEIDIGIMPLADDEWSRGKCGLKGLQYMALGIPTVMSPVGVNSSIIQNGVNGFTPKSEAEWVDCLNSLINSASLRSQLGAAGRETVERNFSVKAWQQAYLTHFQDALRKSPG